MGRTKTEATGADFGKNDPGPMYRHGQDVGHGPNHDCLQCRIARKALVEQAHITGAAERKPDELQSGENPDALANPEREKLDPFIALADDINVAGVSDAEPASPAEAARFAEIADQNTAAIDPFVGVDAPRIGMGALEPGASVRFKSQPTRLIAELAEALDAAWEKAGVAFDESSRFSGNAIDIVDDLQEAMPGLGVMIMNGYVPNDARWHIEMTTGNARAHVKFIDREIAIKLCALTLLDGAKGAEFERALAPYNAADPIAHFTGLTQAKP